LPHPMTPMPSFVFDFPCISDRTSQRGHGLAAP